MQIYFCDLLQQQQFRLLVSSFNWFIGVQTINDTIYQHQSDQCCGCKNNAIFLVYSLYSYEFQV